MRTFYMLAFAAMALFLGVCIGFSRDHIIKTKSNESTSRPCVGYIALDVDRVITCAGDTIRHQRNVHKK